MQVVSFVEMSPVIQLNFRLKADYFAVVFNNVPMTINIKIVAVKKEIELELLT